MSEKRTKADQLQRSIQRTDKRTGAEEDFLEPKQSKVTVLPGPAESKSEKDERDSGEAA